MLADAALIERLFSEPGNSHGSAACLLECAATALGKLLADYCDLAKQTGDLSASVLAAYLSGSASTLAKRRLLCHPLLIESLHRLAPHNTTLGRWHHCVAPVIGEQHKVSTLHSQPPVLGNCALAILLRADRNWLGRMEVATDLFGRVCVPFCDWSLILRTEEACENVAGRKVCVVVERKVAHWHLDSEDHPPFLEMSHHDLVRMVVGNEDHLNLHALRFPDQRLRPRLQFAAQLHRSPIRYDPVGFEDFAAHAGITGAIIDIVLEAIRHNAPDVAKELNTLIHTIRGFELPKTAVGTVESFSEPTIPEVMGVNITYTGDDQPRMNPFCFTWFGHELGHTKDYLIDTVLYDQKTTLLENASEATQFIPRYGRPLSVRTLFQLPYVHLYESCLLTDFLEHRFEGLPWHITDGVVEAGDEVLSEIEESFPLIVDQAKLTPMGLAAVDHFRVLYDRAADRWHHATAHHHLVI